MIRCVNLCWYRQINLTTNVLRRNSLKNLTSIRFVEDLGTYLGFPLVHGRVNIDVYNDVVEKVQRRIASWKSKLLNKARHACLAKSVTTAIPIYSKQLHFLPMSISNMIDPLTRSFIWGKDGDTRGWSLVNWNVITSPQRYDGLGIMATHLSNVVVLGKLVWYMLHEKDRFWVQVLSLKYLGNNSLWSASQGPRHSITWRSILKS